MFRVKNRILITWLIACIVLFSIPIITGVVQIQNIQKLLENEYENINYVIQEKISEQLDSRITNIKTLGRLIQNNMEIDTFLRRSNQTTTSERYLIKDIADFMKTSSIYSDITCCYLYIKNDDLIITSSSVTPRNLVQASPFRDDVIRSLDFSKYITHYYSYSIEVINNLQTNELNLAIISSLPSTSYFFPKAALVQIVELDAIRDILMNTHVDNDVSIFLVDQKQRIITSNQNTLLANQANDIKALEMNDQSGRIDSFITNRDSIVIYNTIEALPDIRCVMVVPITSIQQKMIPAKQSTYLFIIFSVTLGFLLSLMIVYQGYKPIRRIVKQVNPFNNKPNQDAFEQISNALDNIIAQNKRLTEIQEQNNIVLQTKFLKSAFQGGIVDSPATREILRSFNINFIGNLFCVFIIDYRKQINKNLKSPNQLNNLDRLFEDWHIEFNNSIVYYWQEINDQIAVLINFSSVNFSSLYPRFCELTFTWINENSALASISHVRFSLNSINTSFLEAIEKLFTANKQNQNLKNVPLNPFESNSAHFNHSLSHLQEDSLFKSLCAGDESSAIEIVDKIIPDRNQGSQTTLQHRNPAIVYAIINIIWKAMQELPDADDVFIENIANLCNKYIESDEACQMNSIHTLIRFFCSNTQRTNQEREPTLIDKIVECIDLNYMDSSFNVSTLADILGMNLSYLSKHFKSNIGIGLLDYINRVRVEKSKKLILEHNLSISKVSSMVGFNHLNSFIRVFKKYESKTPGEYKLTSNTSPSKS